jgi:hypothetical protein
MLKERNQERPPQGQPFLHVAGGWMDREEAWTGELEVFTEMLLRAHRTEMEDNPLDLFPLTRPAARVHIFCGAGGSFVEVVRSQSQGKEAKARERVAGGRRIRWRGTGL